MRRERWAGFSAIAALAFLVGQGDAGAQAPSTTTPPPDAMGGLTRQVTLSPAEEMAQSETILSQMDVSRNNIRRQLETARAQRDVVKTLCLNDKLNQLDVAVRSARERKQSLDLAANRKDTELANHEFTIMSVLRQRTVQLSAEANQCIGQEAGFVGESAVTSTVDPNLPGDEPNPPPTFPIIAEPPTCTSCVK